MAAALRVRHYHPTDSDRVRELDAAAMGATDAFSVSVPSADLDSIEASYIDVGGEFLVGETGGRIVAMGAFRPATGYVTAYARDLPDSTAELKRMRVDPAFQRRGYGERICAALERRAREHGYTDLVLDTSPDQRGARRLYEKRGFEEGSHERVETDSESFEAVFYHKSIADET